MARATQNQGGGSNNFSEGRLGPKGRAINLKSNNVLNVLCTVQKGKNRGTIKCSDGSPL